MGTLLENNIHQAMRSVAEAIRLDGEDKNKEAYIQYLHCVLFITQNLIQDALDKDLPQIVTATSKKYIKLGQQCMDRVGSVFNRIDSLTRDTGSGVPSYLPLASTTSSSVSSLNTPSPSSSTKQASPCQQPSRQQQAGEGSKKVLPSGGEIKHQDMVLPEITGRPNEPGPLEIAYRQNQLLMAAYKARMMKIGKGDLKATNMSLSLQRRLAENISIAKARQQALEKKMKERQERLEEQAARKFSSTTGMSKDEQERRKLYTKILEFEQDNKWSQEWRGKIKFVEGDAAVIHELVTKILSIRQHPLTQLLNRYQYIIYNKILPLISKHYQSITEVRVPYTPTITTEGGGNGEATKSKCDIQEQVSPPSEEGDSYVTSNSNSESEGLSGGSEPQGTGTDGLMDGESGKDIGGATESIKEDLQSAITAGSELTAKLKQDNQEANKIMPNFHQLEFHASELDDLFDNDDDDDNEGVDEKLQSGKTSQGDNKTPEGQVVDQSDLPVRSPDLSETKYRELHQAAYKRHLENITKDVHVHMEKLQCMFIVAYEELDSPAGRDQCFASLEEPFFKPLWEYLLALYRCVNREKEIEVAKAMTRLQDCSPADMNIQQKLCLDVSPGGATFPYQQAVEELERMTRLVCPLSKMESTVKVSRVICQCVEEYYENQGPETASIAANIGADDLLPIMSYVIVKSALPQIVSECQAMEEFIHEGYLMGEEGYCLTSLQTALQYVYSLAWKK